MFWNIYRYAVFSGICPLRISPRIVNTRFRFHALWFDANITGVIYLAVKNTYTPAERLGRLTTKSKPKIIIRYFEWDKKVYIPTGKSYVAKFLLQI